MQVEYKCGCWCSGPADRIPERCRTHHQPIRVRPKPLSREDQEERGLLSFKSHEWGRCDDCWNTGRIEETGESCGCGRRPWKYPGSGDWSSAARLFNKLRDLRDDGEMLWPDDDEALRLIAVRATQHAKHGFDVAAAVLMVDRDRFFKAYTDETLRSSQLSTVVAAGEGLIACDTTQSSEKPEGQDAN